MERLITADPAGLPSYQLQLAELAWDRGDTDACIRQSRAALKAIDQEPASDNADFDAAVARFAESLMATGQREEALKLCQRANLAAGRDPRLELICRKIAGDEKGRQP